MLHVEILDTSINKYNIEIDIVRVYIDGNTRGYPPKEDEQINL